MGIRTNLFDSLKKLVKTCVGVCPESATEYNGFWNHVQIIASVHCGDRHYLHWEIPSYRNYNFEEGKQFWKAKLFLSMDTWESKGFVSRDTMPCKLITAAEAAKMGSTEWWGLPARPFLPLITALKKPHPASKAPGLEPMIAVGCSWDTWTANIASTSSRAPSAIIRFAPFPASSAGWKSSITVPCNCSSETSKFRYPPWYHQNMNKDLLF